MKVQFFTYLKRHAIPGIIACLCIMASACSQPISGVVYFDSNNNGTQDANEAGAGFVKVMVRHDGEVTAEGLTAQTGTFTAYVRGEPGEYCVEVDPSDPNLLNLVPEGAGLAVGKASIVKAAGINISPSGKEDGDEPPDNTPPDDKTPDDKTPDGKTPKEDTPDDQTGKEDDTKNDSQPTAKNVQNGICQDYGKKRMKGMDVSIGVKGNFAGMISKMDSRLEKKCYAGELCELTFMYPKGCSLKLEPPEYLSFAAAPATALPQQPAEAESEDQAAIATKAKASISASVTAEPSPSQTQSQMKVNKIYMQVNDDIPAGETKLTLKPKVVCADDTHSLPTLPMRLIRESDIRAMPNLEEVGDQFKYDITIENRGKSAIKDGYLIVTLSAGLQITAVDEGCNNLGLSMECSDINVESGKKRTKTVVGKIWSTDEQAATIEAVFSEEKSALEVVAQPVSWVPQIAIDEMKKLEKEADQPKKEEGEK